MDLPPLLIRRAGQAQAIVTLRKQAEGLRSEAVLYGGFMPLRDAPGAPVPPRGRGTHQRDHPTHRQYPALVRLVMRERQGRQRNRWFLTMGPASIVLGMIFLGWFAGRA